jgi:hypothetical protein
MIKCLLWTTLQKGVYDPRAARKLSPISPPDSGAMDDSSMLEDHLSLPWSDDILSTSPDTDSDFADVDADGNDADDFARSLFEDELCSAFSDSISGDSDDLIDAASPFTFSAIDEEEESTESSLEQQHKQGKIGDPSCCPMMDSVYGGFGAMSHIITGYALQRRQEPVSSKNRNKERSLEEPYDHSRAYKRQRELSSAGIPSSPLTFNEEMSPHTEPETDIEIDSGSDLESLCSFEKDLVGQEEEYLIGNESIDNDEDGDEEMLY